MNEETAIGIIKGVLIIIGLILAFNVALIQWGGVTFHIDIFGSCISHNTIIAPFFFGSFVSLLCGLFMGGDDA